MAAFADAGHSITFHPWDRAATSAITAHLMATDIMEALWWLRQRGYAGRIWRAAWTQNDAPQHPAARSMVLAYATRPTPPR